jgi:hypothetical protein
MPIEDYPKDIDPEMVPYMDALNALPGVETRSSCIGHDKSHAHISLCISWSFDQLFRVFMQLEAAPDGNFVVGLNGYEVGVGIPRWVIWFEDKWEEQIKLLIFFLGRACVSPAFVLEDLLKVGKEKIGNEC